MEFEIKERPQFAVPNYSADDYKLAGGFCDAIKKELGEFLKAVVLFGSTARPTAKEQIYERDIDVLLIIDDVVRVLSPELITTYRIIVERTAAKISKRFHVNTLKLTSFWDYVRTGDPLVVNILRDGVPLYDAGFFQPIQSLLFQGKIRPTRESIWSYYVRAPLTINNSEWHVLQATLDLYWAVIDASHAALMKAGEMPPSPEHVSDLISKVLVHKGLVDKSAATTMKFFYDLSKKITHREIQKITGTEYDRYKKEAVSFVAKMKKIIQI
ncbi:nucleotidyltransferase domain-containing protein [Candidatus Woesearchaeota archaeon]|nr:nucleotidyltransferase domain-containing protein [Candidatus Woesearchaeota archaeon]